MGYSIQRKKYKTTNYSILYKALKVLGTDEVVQRLSREFIIPKALYIFFYFLAIFNIKWFCYENIFSISWLLCLCQAKEFVLINYKTLTS